MASFERNNSKGREIAVIEQQWRSSRWKNLRRNYSAAAALRLRSQFGLRNDPVVARFGAERLWEQLQSDSHVKALGAENGLQAVQMVLAGLKSIYVSGWQVAASSNTAGEMYPDQSLYPADSVPVLVKRINNALRRQDEIQRARDSSAVDWRIPIVADAEAGFGGHLNAFELMKSLIVAGAAGVHFEDQLSSAKKCGHLGGKVIIPSSEFIARLNAARLAADVMDVPTLLIARTDAYSCRFLANDIDPRDRVFLTGNRTPEGYFEVRGGLEMAIDRGLAYAPYADLLWWETSTPNIDEARIFAQAIHQEHPGKMLAYNCSPSFHWARHLNGETIASFQDELGRVGYKYQFVTLAGFHCTNHAMFALSRAYARGGMAAYVALQDAEFESTHDGYTAVRHQEFVGTGYFDIVLDTLSGGRSAMLAMEESTEKAQF